MSARTRLFLLLVLVGMVANAVLYLIFLLPSSPLKMDYPIAPLNFHGYRNVLGDPVRSRIAFVNHRPRNCWRFVHITTNGSQ